MLGTIFKSDSKSYFSFKPYIFNQKALFVSLIKCGHEITANIPSKLTQTIKQMSQNRVGDSHGSENLDTVTHTINKIKNKLLTL